MKFKIFTIGYLKDKNIEALIGEYQKRMNWNIEFYQWQDKKNLPTAKRMQAEGEWLLEASVGTKKVALDEAGKTLNSREFSGKISDWQDVGEREISLLIGGADGLSADVKKHCDLALSFGRMTMPHMMVRLVLAEQLYRAYTIITKHPYHRD